MNIPDHFKSFVEAELREENFGNEIAQFAVFHKAAVPEQLKKGGGGMISKVNDTKGSLRIIMVLPQDEINQKYFRYSVYHEYLDNSTNESIHMMTIEQKVFDLFLKEYQGCDKQIWDEFINSRIDFFQGSREMNKGSQEYEMHNRQIEETIQWIKKQKYYS